MNEAGQFAFVAYREPVGGGGQLSTLFFVEPGGSVSIALKPGDPIPGQGGRAFSDFGHPVINAAGEFAFSGRSLDDDNNSISGLYVWRQGQVDVVLESGREAPGSGGATIDTFYYKSVGFNDLGDVAFIATLDDGRRGVFLATSIEASVPALMPGALFALAAGLAGIGGISLLRQRRSP
jgi:hypothetical protein